MVYADIELINADDVAFAKRHIMELVVNPEHPNYAVLKMK